MSFVLAIDQGTTSSRAIILDEKLNVRGVGQKEFTQIFPKPGWVEHDPAEIWYTVEYSIRTALENAGLDGSQIDAIGITNQRETTVAWESDTHKALYNAIVWQCGRTTDICAGLKHREPLFRQKTGLVVDPYFSGTKMLWMLENVPKVKAAAEHGTLRFGTIDCFLLYRLTDGSVHATDVSNASRTLLMNINTVAWDGELCDILRVPMGALPRIVSSSEVYGHTRGMESLPDGIPISGIAGDQQAALFGQAGFEDGQAKCTYGTGSFLLMNTGKHAVPSNTGLLTTIAWKLGGEVTYALEGSSFIAGAAVQWLRDGLEFFHSAPQVEALAASVPDSGGVVMVPALVGLGAPHWRPDARGLICGISRGTTRAHIARAVLEGIAMQQYEIIKAMETDSGISLKQLRVDGGASANNLLMQMQADFLDRTIVRPKMIETTALGAAFLAGLAVGVWKDLDELRQTWRVDREFEPKITAEEREGYVQRWKDAVSRA